ncbi:uncharacterized protein V6R79_018956 [Siganus canaliculatus]
MRGNDFGGGITAETPCEIWQNARGICSSSSSSSSSSTRRRRHRHTQHTSNYSCCSREPQQHGQEPRWPPAPSPEEHSVWF